MTPFDIRSLADFEQPRFLCEKCRAILIDAPWAPKESTPCCHVCGVEYEPSKHFDRWRTGEYLESRGLKLRYENLLKQCIDLARTTRPANVFYEPPTPLHTLLEALSLAKVFVHFTSFGISEFFLGALKVVAQRIPVRGIVSNVDERTLDELTIFAEDAPHGNFEVKTYLRDGIWAKAPHQKLIVVDGLLAFKGSANLTLAGWRKAAEGLDHVEVVTNTSEVIELHNKLFAKVWSLHSNIGSAVNTGAF